MAMELKTRAELEARWKGSGEVSRMDVLLETLLDVREMLIIKSECSHRGLADWVDGFGWKCRDCGESSNNHGGTPGTSGKDSNASGAKGG